MPDTHRDASPAACASPLDAPPDGFATPALVVDLDVLDRNVRRMAQAAVEGGFVLRPHAKTHKCLPIAARQLSAGAVGLTVATIGEAEAFAAAGVTDLFIAYPLWLDDGKRARVAALAATVRLSVGVDSAENAARLAGTGARAVIEIDSGHIRVPWSPNSPSTTQSSNCPRVRGRRGTATASPSSPSTCATP
jgi:D-serine deaminase-like pyridoxal phosphate-dependent protein